MRISMRWATWSGGPVTSFCPSLLGPSSFIRIFILARARPYVSLRYSAIYNSRMAREDRFGSSPENRASVYFSLMELPLSGSWMGCVYHAASAAYPSSWRIEKCTQTRFSSNLKFITCVYLFHYIFFLEMLYLCLKIIIRTDNLLLICFCNVIYFNVE